VPEIDESWFVPDTVTEAPLRKFAPEEMVTCNDCLRANPPTRGQCMYCGAPMNLVAASSDVETTASESSDQPSHFVVVQVNGAESLDEVALDQLSVKFHFKPEELRAALMNVAPIPLASASTAEDATRIVSDLQSLGIERASFSAVELNGDIVPVGIRALQFADESITAISRIGKKPLSAALSDLQLIVTGRLLVHRVEVDERRSRSAVKPLDRRELSQDQSIIDLYLQSSAEPWRIIVNDFDFSCLEERKALTAFDNASALIELLKERTPATVNGSYAQVRSVLANIWPLQSTASQSRSRRPRAGRNEFSTVTASDNEAQFNNYSRLVWNISRGDQQRDEDVAEQGV